MSTIEERLTVLEAKTQDVSRRLSDDGTVPYLFFNCRLGVMTEFWAKKPIGQGAALSIGTAIDRFGAYVEIDEESCPDHASTAVFASCVPAPVHGQDHLAFEGVAGNGLNNYGLALTMGARIIRWRTEGIELLGDYTLFMLGKIGGVIKILWP